MTTVPTQSVVALAAAALTAIATLGCATAPSAHEYAISPRSLAQLRTAALPAEASHQPTVALLLGGGGLRGFAHVGVLRALEEAGIRPDIVVGTSAGAAVGAAFASGLTAAQIEDASRLLDLSSLADWTLSTRGFIRGDAIARWIDTVTNHRPVERFPIRFAAVATDLCSQRTVVLDSGPAGRAVQASAAVPGVSMPVAYGGGHLVDGGATSLVPVSVARAMGAQIVIAIDIYCSEAYGVDDRMPAVVTQVMRAQSCRIAEMEKAAADVVIEPAVGTMKLADRAQHRRAVAVGYQTARAVLAQAVWPYGPSRHLRAPAAAPQGASPTDPTARPAALDSRGE